MEDPALETVLHYLYTRCLPSTLATDTAQRTLDATAHLVPALTDLREKCEVFIRNTALRNSKSVKQGTAGVWVSVLLRLWLKVHLFLEIVRILMLEICLQKIYILRNFLVL